MDAGGWAGRRVGGWVGGGLVGGYGGSRVCVRESGCVFVGVKCMPRSTLECRALCGIIGLFCGNAGVLERP